MEKIISNKAASFASMELARYALERADLRAGSILEQYRKSTDRNYTLVVRDASGLFPCFF